MDADSLENDETHDIYKEDKRKYSFPDDRFNYMDTELLTTDENMPRNSVSFRIDEDNLTEGLSSYNNENYF